MRNKLRSQLRRRREREALHAKWLCGADRRITRGSGNIFVDLGFDAADAEKAMHALREFHAKGGVRYEDFRAELGDLLREPAPWEGQK